jgi:hypothetical protein
MESKVQSAGLTPNPPHQAIAPNLHPMFAAPFGQQFDVGRVVPLVEEHLLAAVSALRDVVGHPRNDYSCQSCHALNIPALPNRVNN